MHKSNEKEKVKTKNVSSVSVRGSKMCPLPRKGLKFRGACRKKHIKYQVVDLEPLRVKVSLPFLTMCFTVE